MYLYVWEAEEERQRYRFVMTNCSMREVNTGASCCKPLSYDKESEFAELTVLTETFTGHHHSSPCWPQWNPTTSQNITTFTITPSDILKHKVILMPVKILLFKWPYSLISVLQSSFLFSHFKIQHINNILRSEYKWIIVISNTILLTYSTC